MNLSRPHHVAWLVAGLLFAGSLVNYVDRAALAVVKTKICEELDLTNTDYGLALDAFLVAYMILYVVGGRMADRLGYDRMFTVTIVFWSVASMAHGLVTGLLSLCLFRALLGIGEGGFYPVALRGSAEWFPPETRSKAIGLYLCGLSVGALLAPPLVAWIATNYGWRASFLFTGALGFLLVPPWVLLHRRIRPAHGRHDAAFRLGIAANPGSGTDAGLPLAAVLRRGKYWRLLAARALTDGAWWFFLFWTPGYFQEARGFDLNMVGRWLWIPYLAADLGALGGGWLAAALIARGLGASFARKLVLVPSALLAASGSLTCFVGSPFLALGFLSAALFGHLSWSTNVHTAISEVSPPRHQAVLYGITGAAGTLAGALTQPLIGLVVDLVGYEPAFVGVAAAYLLAIALLLAVGRIEPLR